jgi:cation-transporting P-type ATPase C
MPVMRAVGDSVYAGTVVVSGSIKVRVTSVGSDTVVGRLIQQVEEAQTLRPRIQTVGDAFAKRVVPSSFAAALLVFLVTRDPRRALTMMLVACPCAAGLATPTAVSASIGNGARRGILIKGGTHLEAMAEIDTICFDKTGTLTESHPAVQQLISLDQDYDETQILQLASRVERHSQHPLALAILEKARHQNAISVSGHEDDNFEILSGRGVRTWNLEEEVLAGNERLLSDRDIPLTEDAKAWDCKLADKAVTSIFVVHQRRPVGIVTVAAAVRPEAIDSVVQLRRAGVGRLVMLTGDGAAVAKAVAGAVGVDEWHSSLLPQGKFQAIQRLRDSGKKVAMVGDGINDAPALALADVGIAMGTGGSDVAIETADVALAADDLRGVSSVVHLSRQTMSVIRQNYGLALGTNSIGLYLAAMGSINPIIAAVLHNLSTILVIANSTRLIGYDPTGRGERFRYHMGWAPHPRHGHDSDRGGSSCCASGTTETDQQKLKEHAA